MDNKTKDAVKTKDAIRQLQVELKQVQALLAGQRPAPPEDSTAVSETATPAKKGAAIVQYTVTHPGVEGTEIKTGAISVTAAQISQVTDEALAEIGYALSSPQKVGLLRALLERGSESAAALGEATQLSTGSLYHHLRDLMHADLITQSARNRYLLTERGLRVLLVALALAVGK